MLDIDAFRNLPDISFIDDLTIDSLLAQARADYEAEYSRLSGENKVLYPADKMNILLQTQVLKLYQLCQYAERTGKQQLLKYSKGQILEHLAALRSVTRLPAKHAETVLQFTLSTILPYKAVIPAGTLVTAGDNIFFATKNYAEIPAGGISVEVKAVCTVAGVTGNAYYAGRLNIIVQPFPYAAKVVNTQDAEGGIEQESDESLAERTFLAPSGYSVAGPDGAYLYWVKSYNQSITDANVYTPSRGVVDIRILLENGELPGEALLSGLTEFLNEQGVRPLTDQLIIAAPEIVEYDIDFTYYIRSNDRNNAAGIQTRLNTALNNYIRWQDEKIGRDINPSVMHQFLMESGIKRLELSSPAFLTVPSYSVARLRFSNVMFGGIEVD